MRHIICFLATLLIVPSCLANTIHVPSEQPTIQLGIDSAGTGDTVLVAEGRYFERVNFRGMAVLLASTFITDGDTSHIGNTILDGSSTAKELADTATVVCFVSGEDSLSVLEGLTICNGLGTDGYGGGILCDSASPSIRNCRLVNNTADNGGGICYRNSSSPTLVNCLVEDGIYGEEAGYLRIFASTVEAAPYEDAILGIESQGCHIEDSQINGSMEYVTGAGIELTNCVVNGSIWDLGGFGMIIEGCKILGDLVSYSSYFELRRSRIAGIIDARDTWSFADSCDIGGLEASGSSTSLPIHHTLIRGECQVSSSATVYLQNCTILDRISVGRVSLTNCILAVPGESAIRVTAEGDLGVSCTDIYGTNLVQWLDGLPDDLDTANLFFLDPLFCDSDSGDYHLLPGSPAAAGNNSCATLLGAFEEGCTSECGDADGNSIVNISDVVYLIAYIFGGGPAPEPLLAGDADCNGIVNISDAVYLIAYIFGGGPEPCAECP